MSSNQKKSSARRPASNATAPTQLGQVSPAQGAQRLFSRIDARLLTGSWASGKVWERLKSWLSVDRELVEFFNFIEEEIAAPLDSKAQQEALRRLPKHLRPADLAPLLPTPFDRLRQRLHEHLLHPRNRLALFLMLTALKSRGWSFDPAEWLSPPVLPIFAHWLSGFDFDNEAYAQATNWHRQPALAEPLTYRGIPLGPGFEYEVMRALVKTSRNVAPMGGQP